MRDANGSESRELAEHRRAFMHLVAGTVGDWDAACGGCPECCETDEGRMTARPGHCLAARDNLRGVDRQDILDALRTALGPRFSQAAAVKVIDETLNGGC